MHVTFKTVFAGAALALVAASAFAQTATPRIDQREANQQARIDAGVASGQLNARETNRLDKQQGRVAGAEANAKADGVVTRGERRHITRMQNRSSANIYRQKHDTQTAKP